MDREHIFFLISESRCWAFGKSPQDESLLDGARDAIIFGDKNIKIVEVEIEIGLTESKESGFTSISFKNEQDIMENATFLELFHERKLNLQKEVWDSMPEGIYRLKKKRVGGEDRAINIAYCPDIGDDSWEEIESSGWNRSKIVNKTV